MTKKQKLTMSIKLHSALYDKGTPLISDEAYDAMVLELHMLDGGASAQPVAPPTVGSPVGAGNPKVAHPALMLSLNNAFNEAQRAEAWHAIVRQAPKAEGVAELKIDGMALRLEYLNGQLVSAATRGNGVVGENVLSSAKMMVDVPKQLRQAVPGRISVVGEAYMPNSHFTLLNAERQDAGEERYASPRNTVAGGLRHSDPEETRKRGIRFFAYGLLSSDRPRGLERHSDVMEWLCELGFRVIERSIVGLRTEGDIDRAFEKLSAMSARVDYDCDGVVVKLDSLAQREILGAGTSAPNWAFACKFAPKAERTRLLEVFFTVGRTGAVTPVGVVKPVVIGDVTVSRLTLHNRDIIERLDLRVGDSILVKRAGDVIPAVDTVYVEERTGDERHIAFPAECPACGAALTRAKNEARIYCPNRTLCPGQIQRALEHFVGRDYMNIQGVGPKQIEQLISQGLVKQIADLYRLRAEGVSSLNGFQAKKTENLIQEIAGSKKRPLSRLLASLGIREVGRSASVNLAERFGDMDALLDATYEEIRDVKGFGPTMARSFCDYFANPNNRQQIEMLKNLGVNMKEPTMVVPVAQESTVLPLVGMNVCATGKLAGYSRQGINARIEELGGKAQSSVTKATDLLVVGARAGSKLAKAEKLGIRVVSEAEFEAIYG